MASPPSGKRQKTLSSDEMRRMFESPHRGTCALPGCQAPTAVDTNDPNGCYFRCCSKECEQMMPLGGDPFNAAPQHANSDTAAPAFISPEAAAWLQTHKRKFEETCMICQLEFEAQDEIIYCHTSNQTTCRCMLHVECMEAHFKANNKNCPVCKARIGPF